MSTGARKNPQGAGGKDEPPLDPALPSVWETLGKHHAGEEGSWRESLHLWKHW